MTFDEEYYAKKNLPRLKDALNAQEISDDDINNALVMSASFGNLKVVKLLLEHKANIIYEADYALQLSVEKGHLKVVKLLLEFGANVNRSIASAQFGHTKVVKLLLEHGADVHVDDDYALRHSARNGHFEVVKLLLEYGANVHAGNGYALALSLENGHLELVRLLLLKGAIVYDPENDHYYVNNGKLEMTQILLEKSIPEYSLLVSVKNGHLEVVKLLLRYYSPRYILKHNLHKIDKIRVCLEEYLLYRKRLVLVQRLVLDWLWKPSGIMCRKNWEQIKQLN